MCRNFSLTPTPASEETLCKFATYLALHNISCNSIKVYLSGVRQLHVREGLPPPQISDMARLAQVLRGIKSSQATARLQVDRHRLPNTSQILCRLKAHWKQQPPSQDRIMLWAGFLTCFFGFFRSGEICSKGANSFNPSSDLSVDRVKVDSLSRPTLVQMLLPMSKTDRSGKGAVINLPRTADDLCPVAAILSWLVYRGKTPGPLFIFESGAKLTRPRFVSELKKAMSEAGMDPTHFSGHSFGIGVATTAAAEGIANSQINYWAGGKVQLCKLT